MGNPITPIEFNHPTVIQLKFKKSDHHDSRIAIHLLRSLQERTERAGKRTVSAMKPVAAVAAVAAALLHVAGAAAVGCPEPGFAQHTLTLQSAQPTSVINSSSLASFFGIEGGHTIQVGSSLFTVSSLGKIQIQKSPQFTPCLGPIHVTCSGDIAGDNLQITPCFLSCTEDRCVRAEQVITEFYAPPLWVRHLNVYFGVFNGKCGFCP